MVETLKEGLPRPVKPVKVKVGDKIITLVSKERAQEIREWSLEEAKRIKKKDPSPLSNPLSLISFLVECIITGGNPSSLDPQK